MISGGCCDGVSDDDSGGDDSDVAATADANGIFDFCDVVVLTGTHWATLNVTKYTLIAENLKCTKNHTIFSCIKIRKKLFFLYIKGFLVNKDTY